MENSTAKWKRKIISFLKERSEGAFAFQEIMGGIHCHTDFTTPEVAKMQTFAMADFTALLCDLVKSGKIKMRAVRGRMYFMARGDIVAKCPRFGVEVAAKKT